MDDIIGIILMSVMFIELMVIMIIFLMGGPALGPILKARMKKADLLLILRKTGNCKLLTAKLGPTGALETDIGMFLVTPGSMRPFFAGTQIGVAYEKIGAVPSPEFVEACRRAKDYGLKDGEAVKTAIASLQQRKEELEQEGGI